MTRIHLFGRLDTIINGVTLLGFCSGHSDTVTGTDFLTLTDSFLLSRGPPKERPWRQIELAAAHI